MDDRRNRVLRDGSGVPAAAALSAGADGWAAAPILGSTILPLQRLQPPGNISGNAGPRAAVDLGLVDPLIERLRRAADLRGNRANRRPA